MLGAGYSAYETQLIEKARRPVLRIIRSDYGRPQEPRRTDRAGFYSGKQ
jgi:hypothetical protein